MKFIMKFRFLFIILFCVALFGAMPASTFIKKEAPPVRASEYVFFSKAELKEWQKRWYGLSDHNFNRPGAEFAGSPDEVSRLKAQAQEFKNRVDKSFWRWKQVDLSAQNRTVPRHASSKPGKAGVRILADAAFVALLEDDVATKNTIKNELLAQSRVPHTNLSDKAWVSHRYSDENIIFRVGDFMSCMMTTYIYVQDVFSPQEKQQMLDYFEAAALFLAEEINFSFESILENRDANNPQPLEQYRYKGEKFLGEKTHLGGYPTTTLMRRYNNRKTMMLLPVAIAAFLRDNEYLKNTCALFVKEYLAFAVFPDYIFAELHRASSKRKPGITGLAYNSTTLGVCVFIADVFARHDDPSLYEFKTTYGMDGTEGNTQKNLKDAILAYGDYYRGNKVVYCWDGVRGNPNHRIDGTQGIEFMLTDVTGCLMANHYYRDKELKSFFYRETKDLKDFVKKDNTKRGNTWGSNNGYRGVAGVLPSAFLMYGYMEDSPANPLR